MSERDQPQRGTAKSAADQTLLGVAPPRIDSSAESPQRSPVFVRSGTSSADVEPAPLPRMALPSRPPPASSPALPTPSTGPGVLEGVQAQLGPALAYARVHPVLGMVVIPVLFSVCLIALTRHASTHPRRIATTHSTAVARPSASSVSAASAPKAASLAELERRPPSSLSSRELVWLAEGHAQQKRALASALREKLERDPAFGKDGAVQTQLLQLAGDPATATDALSAMVLLEPPVGADLLYEVWTGTSVRTDTTELAHALLYSTDVRPKASPALAVALALRVAETCAEYQAILPKALTDGDHRALHLLTKLNGKRGCGPKKLDDCYACLRAKSDELTATINAVKSRHAPSFASQ
ncbi:MAG TPA: hypothetical protein VNW92_03595 [Polyangiaceae bacterium]|nr:hypothetical protein [Polyangiaceae bacterium]